MNAAVTQDELGTHLDWELDGVTATMIDCSGPAGCGATLVTP